LSESDFMDYPVTRALQPSSGCSREAVCLGDASVTISCRALLTLLTQKVAIL